MASDPTAGGAPADGPVDPDDIDIPPRPESAAEWQRLVEQLQAEKADLQDKQLRALAEAQNVRRRAQQDIEKERKFGNERFARDVLSVADNFGRALSALPADLDSLDPALRKPFNAEFHQAMMEVENPDVPSGTVVQELIPGYLIAGRLLRAAMVAVSKGGPAAGPSASNEN